MISAQAAVGEDVILTDGFDESIRAKLDRARTELLDLYFDARTLEEEQGVNVLYLALGFLKWFEAPSSDIPRFAPLLLVPVALERGTAAERFRLRWTQEDPASNLSLLTLMRREHGL